MPNNIFDNNQQTKPTQSRRSKYLAPQGLPRQKVCAALCKFSCSCDIDQYISEKERG